MTCISLDSLHLSSIVIIIFTLVLITSSSVFLYLNHFVCYFYFIPRAVQCSLLFSRLLYNNSASVHSILLQKLHLMQYHPLPPRLAPALCQAAAHHSADAAPLAFPSPPQPRPPIRIMVPPPCSILRSACLEKSSITPRCQVGAPSSSSLMLAIHLLCHPLPVAKGERIYHAHGHDFGRRRPPKLSFGACQGFKVFEKLGLLGGHCFLLLQDCWDTTLSQGCFHAVVAHLLT
mmetsp:Transcript_25345/g.37747  ORF Transcript_25345/g.37747 Transcript_25345/m.37747 type:complete len:232 (-) Transcript_25345:107-802(-)